MSRGTKQQSDATSKRQSFTFVEVICAHGGPEDCVNSVVLLTRQQFLGKGGVQHGRTGGALAQDDLRGHQGKEGSGRTGKWRG